MTIKLLNQDDTELDSQNIDFPLESMVVGGRFDEESETIVLTLQNETEVSFSVASLVNGLINKETFDSTVQELQGKIVECVKTADFQKSQADQDEKIKALEDDVKKKITEYSDLINKSCNTVSGTGEDVTLKDTVESRFRKLQVGGNSWQETREGYNLLNVAGGSDSVEYETEDFTITNNKDGSITLNGTLTKANRYYLSDKPITYINDKANFMFEVISGSATVLNGFLFVFYGGNGSENKEVSAVSIRTAPADKFSQSYTITTKETTVRPYLHFGWTESKGGYAEFNNYRIRLQVSEGEEDKPYEPYGATPSPEFPSEIRNVEGEVDINVSNEEQTQTVNFPLQHGQVLHEGDYLSKNGIVQIKGQKEYDGTENWYSVSNTTIALVDPDIYGSTPILSTRYPNSRNKNLFMVSRDKSNGHGVMVVWRNEEEKLTLEDFKAQLAQWKEEGNPLKVEYELADPIITPYTPEQRKAYDEIMQLTSYEDTTHIFSTNDISPIFDITAYAKANNTIQDQSSNEVQSEPTIEEPELEDSQVKDFQEPTFEASVEQPSYEEDTEDEEVIE